MQEFICPMCRKGKHDLCSPDWCDCQHKPQQYGTLIDDEGRLSQ